MTSRPPLVDVHHLRVQFETGSGIVVGVDDVSFHLMPSETLCLVGESGSGKSVSALSLLRLEGFGGGKISAGSLLYHHQGGEIDLVEVPDTLMRQIRGQHFGMVFQEPMTALNPVLTVGYQLMEGLRTHLGLSVEQARKRALTLLQDVHIPEPEHRLKQYPHELSGGLRQRVVIAMAIACQPRLLICDEPTTALDVTMQAEILSLINRLKREYRMAVLFITHDMAVVAQMADRVGVLLRGQMIEQGTVLEIFENPQHDYTRSLLASVPRLGEKQGKASPESMKIMGPVGPPRSHETITAERQVLLEVEQLIVRYPVRRGLLRRIVANVHAVEDVSFSLNKGDTLSIVGESGCGKSSCGRCILRLVEPQQGSVRLEGHNVMAMDHQALRRARRHMQMIFQDPFASLNPQIRLMDQVAEPLKNYGLAKGEALVDQVVHLFQRVELPRSFLRRYPHQLSGGQRQRVAIARCLALNPKLIVADEAVSALDVSVQAQILNLMLALQEELGVALLFISHDLAVVERISHYVAVMCQGRIVEMGPRAAIFENPYHEYTKSLLAAVPVADPRQREGRGHRKFESVHSTIFPAGYDPAPSVYEEVESGHFVLRPPIG